MTIATVVEKKVFGSQGEYLFSWYGVSHKGSHPEYWCQSREYVEKEAARINSFSAAV